MEDPGSQDLILQFVLLFVLTLLNAFFSATEMSMVSLNRSRVEQKAEEELPVIGHVVSEGGDACFNVLECQACHRVSSLLQRLVLF